MMRPVITLMTDFGTADGYVAEMKGVLLNQLPDVTLVDLTHDLEPHDVEGARLALARCWLRFPPGTVHLVVVDPGVGSPRAALAVASDGRFLVGPDNGVLSPALLFAGATAVSLQIPPQAAPTFHGRDVFAPAAAQLARGTPLDSLGAPFDQPVVLRTKEPHRAPGGAIVGEVITIDRFGNAITNLIARGHGYVEVEGRVLPLLRTYAEIKRGEGAAVTGSSGLLEIAMCEGRAADAMRLRRGTVVILRSGP